MIGVDSLALLTKITEVLKTDITKELLTKEISFRKKNEQDSQPHAFLYRLKKRRSIMDLGQRIDSSQSDLAQHIFQAVQTCPSSFMPSATRTVLLLNQSHQQFWDMVAVQQKRELSASIFESTEMKMQQCKRALGTILFYEDQGVLTQLQKQRPLDAHLFPMWSEQNSGMAQLAAWTALADVGLGAHIQYYDQLDSQVAAYFSIEKTWRMKAQLVFGSIESEMMLEEQKIAADDFKIFA